MSDSNIWQQKIQAFLHDPPGKPLDILKHESQAANLARIIGIDYTKQNFQEADWIASAADRLNFPSYYQIGGANFSKKPYLTHPLSGVRLNLGAGRFLPSQINPTQLQEAVKASLEHIPDEVKEDSKKLYLWLWRNWSKAIQNEQGEQLGVLWDLLPADTRIPDHSIWMHQSLTSAIATALPQPAFLLFTLGPVQAFISAARRTQDLWAGSYLLSYLNWTAIESVVDKLGVDAVIFPNLYEQPLCDRWLYSQGILANPPEPEDLILPSLPNRFFAIVPQDRGADLAREAEQELRSRWEEITHQVRQDLESYMGQQPQWSVTWERQIKNLFETYWQVYPWLPAGDKIQDKNYQFLDPHRPYLGERVQATEKILKVYATPDREGGGQYQPNIGAIYSDLYYITEKALGSRKSIRDFPQVEERGDKSTLGGDRAALYDGIDHLMTPEGDFDRVGRRDIIHFWQDLAQNLQRQGRYEIKDSGEERLDAIELTKRLAWRSYFRDQEGYETENGQYELRFPSTSSVATAKFKADILELLRKPQTDDLYNALKAWVCSIPISIRQRNTVRKNVVPYLSHKSWRDSFITQFLKIDGRLLFLESYSEETDQTITAEDLEETTRALKTFVNLAQDYGISKPRKYYAVLMMDGDNMGQWLSGAKMPQYQQVLHPDTHEKLQEREDWSDILNSPRLMSPAIHGFVSKALGDFSLKLVRHIVETRYPGKLVYAGGDDVLALLPLDSALEVARELRAAFSGEIYTGEIGTDQECQKFEVQFGQQKAGYVWLELADEKQLLTTMGYTATASSGIAIAYHKDPLDVTLQEVRQAEKRAKGDEGRNAFSITFLKRSGEIMNAGAKWTYGSEEQPLDTVAILQEFQAKFADNTLSSKFPYVLREEAQTLSLLEIPELYQAEIKRLLLRQQGKQPLTKQKAGHLAQKLATLVMEANHAQKEGLSEEEQTTPQGKLSTFADLLTLARFLATAEGEE